MPLRNDAVSVYGVKELDVVVHVTAMKMPTEKKKEMKKDKKVEMVNLDNDDSGHVVEDVMVELVDGVHESNAIMEKMVRIPVVMKKVLAKKVEMVVHVVIFVVTSAVVVKDHANLKVKEVRVTVVNRVKEVKAVRVDLKDRKDLVVIQDSVVHVTRVVPIRTLHLKNNRMTVRPPKDHHRMYKYIHSSI
jgi:hypothetical protein